MFNSFRLLLLSMGLLLPGALAAADPDGRQWPWWRGPYSNGNGVPTEGELRELPRVLWHSKEFTKTAHGDLSKGNLVGGCQSLVMHDDKVYVSFYIGSQDPVVLDAVSEDPKVREQYAKWLDGTAKKGPCTGHPGSLSLGRVGFTEKDLDTVIRMATNIHADDVMVCLDATTGETLWRTAVPGGVNHLRQNYGTHYTPSVDPSTGIVYMVATMGRLCAFDGTTGELLWKRDAAGEKSWAAAKEKALADRSAPGILRREFQCAFALDGVLVVGGQAYDGATGETRWSKGGSWFWVPWQHQGKWYLINGGSMCIDPQSGEDLWELPKEQRRIGTGSTGLAVVVSGDILITERAGYRISPQGRELLWENPALHNQHSSSLVVRGESFYMVASDPVAIAEVRKENPGVTGRDFDRALRAKVGKRTPTYLLQVGVQTGEIEKKWKFTSRYRFAVGCMLTTIGQRLFWLGKGGEHFLFDPDKTAVDGFTDEGLSIADLAPDHEPDLGIYRVQTPINYKGRMYARAGWSVVCLDFNKND